MSMRSKVLWSEGLFLQAQHFQQQDRFFLGQLREFAANCLPYAWGFTELEFDAELLRQGKLSIKKASGVFPDGTLFSIPEVDSLPGTLDVGPLEVGVTELTLCIPLQRHGASEVADESEPGLRYLRSLASYRDSTSDKGQEADIEIAQLNCQFRRGSEDLSGYSMLPIARLGRSSQDAPAEMDTDFVPPLLNIRASAYMAAKLEEILGLIQYRAESLSGRLRNNERGSSAAIQDFMCLQLLNRVEPLFAHVARANFLHPYNLYLYLIQFLGEFASFTESRLLPPEMPRYQQAALTSTFQQLFAISREYLSTVQEQTAVMMDLTERKYGIHVAPINDRSQLDSCIFVLSVKGKVDRTQLRKSLPSLIRIAPVEKIRDIISARTSGIPVSPMTSDPRQLPYSSEATYFELDQSGELWALMKKSGGFAIHVDMDIPELQMELWVIRT